MKDGRSREDFAVLKDKASVVVGGNRNGQWKITARFVVHTKDGDVPCIRLRWGNNQSEHYTEDEFQRLFKMVEGEK